MQKEDIARWKALSDSQRIKYALSACGYTIEQLARYLGAGHKKIQWIMENTVSESGSYAPQGYRLTKRERSYLLMLFKEFNGDLDKLPDPAPSLVVYPADTVLDSINTFAPHADNRFAAFIKGNVVAAQLAHYITFDMQAEPDIFKRTLINIENRYPTSSVYYGGVVIRNYNTKDKATLGITLSPDNTGYVTLHVKWKKGFEYLKVYDNLSENALRHIARQAVRCLRPTYRFRYDATNCKITKHGTKRNRNTKRKPGLPGSSSLQSAQGS